MVPPEPWSLGRQAPRAPSELGARIGASLGLTNGVERRSSGMTNGLGGRTNGLTTGLRGHTNGLVNGLRAGGRTNGVGYTNGLPLRQNPFGVVTNSDFRRAGVIVAALFVLTLVLAYVLGTPAPPPQAFTVDGKFSDWAKVPEYVDPQDTSVGHVDLVGYRVQQESGQLFVYGRTRSPLFFGPEASSIYLLVDNRDPGGYEAPGLTVNYVAEIWGWNGTLQGEGLREWRGGADPDNATAFWPRGSFPAASVGNEFELALDESVVGLDVSPAFRLSLVARADDVIDETAVVGPSPGALLVAQRPLTTIVSGASSVLEVRMRALVADVTVTDISVQVIGGGTLTLPNLPIRIVAGNETVSTVSLDTGSLPGGTFVTVAVTGVNATAGAGATIPITLTGDEARVYVQSVPVGKVVDGLFGDWSNSTTDPDDTTVPASVDLLESATSLGTSDFYFFVRTEGKVLAGAVLPERHATSPWGGPNATSPPVPIRRLAGEDVLRTYVDTDDRDTSGMPFGGITADRLLEVRGRVGRITSEALYAWNETRSSWEARTAPFSIAFVGTRFEASASLSFLGPTFNPRVVFAMSDWMERRDITDLLAVRGTRSAPILGPTHGPGAESIQATLLVNTPTVDGRCATFPGEYTGATTVSTPDLDVIVGRRDNSQFVYVCIRAKSDIIQDPSDFGEIMFDTKHDGGTAPQSDDRLFDVFTNSNSIETWMGNGAAWVPCGGSCDAGDIAEGRWSGFNEQYEFRIRFIDVWGTNAPSRNQVAGFAVVVYDFPLGSVYTWGSTAVDDTNPGSWGHIVLPEFPSAGVAVGAAAIVVLIRRRVRLTPSQRRVSKGQCLPTAVRPDVALEEH